MGNGQSQGKRKRAEKESTERAYISPVPADVGSSQHGVFLSFRGTDTRKTFTDHLYHSLIKAGTVPICVFRDDNSIPIGEDFGSWILDAIARSKISIPIISENYASSKWCLRELIHIMDSKKSTSHIVLPIFYKVDPSDVRYLKGRFGEAFHSRKKRFDEKDIQEGQRALREVSYLHGWESEKVANGYEGELVEKVVKNILSKLRQDFQLDVPKHLVGIGDHVNEIKNWVYTPANVARMIGIYGMGGIGKTTLAKVIYNQLSNDFVHRSFLADIRETTHRKNIPYLQKQLIKDILQIEHQVENVDNGISLIKSSFRGKKVLILLDDIDDKNQLDALAREHNWFMAESIIIVTTRNEAIIDQSKFGVDYKYELKEMDKVNSLALFNRHAFCTEHSPRDFEGISHDIISTLGGLPLALQVVGSYLYKKANRKVWEDVRKQLKNQPHRDVQKILRISYDALEDGHKYIFLDIICFFIGKESDEEVRKYAMYVWEDCGFYPSQGIEELKLRCLIKIGDDGEFMIHDQLRDLGRRIFCQEQPLEKRSGPWDHNYKGVPRVLRHQGWEFHKPWFDDLMRAASSGDSNKLLCEIRWLQWWVYESKLSKLPLSTTNLHLPKLQVLELSRSKITEDWEGWSLITTAKGLQVLDLRCCHGLTCTPDLSAFAQLKILNLRDCSRLEHLHPSVGKLTSLVSLDLSKCPRLKELPEEVGKLKDLEELLLDSASSITEIPTSIGDLRNLQHLGLGYSGIEKLPSEIGDLSSLKNLHIYFTSISDLPESIWNLSLQSLNLWGCNKLQSLPKFPSDLTDLSIHGSMKPKACLIYRRKHHLLEDPELSSRPLKRKIVFDNWILFKLDGLKNLEEFSIKRCSFIERLDLSQLIRLKRLRIEDCNNLVEIQGHDNLEFLEGIFIYGCNSIKRLLYPESWCLKRLVAVRCNNLVEIQGPDDFIGCKSKETLPYLNGCERLQSLVVQDCKKLTQLRGLENLDLIDLDISGCDSLEAIPKLSGTRIFRNYESEPYYDS